ncbi:MAG: Dyp-type peroxidase [Candidatus Tectomicrobia bacterium]|nr:Dyp-type peroxidase [Candidatus Tectomicrobia bacterium]
MPTPQDGIPPEPGAFAYFLILKAVNRAAEARELARRLRAVPATLRAVAALDEQAGLRCVASLGAEFWAAIAPNRRPRELRSFQPIRGAGLEAPASGGDILLHITSQRHDLNFELARRLRAELGAAATVLDEVSGFRYLDSRDLTGFIDGTENPKGAERAAVALIGEEDADFAGGSYVLTQRYVHNLTAWSALAAEAQEKIIGRTKPDSVELAAGVKPQTAHISRVVIEEEGEELEIVRHSFPYGTTSEAGLFFIAYAKTLSTFDKMLARMFGASGDGRHDHLMDFTRALSGAYFFAPSEAGLSSLDQQG